MARESFKSTIWTICSADSIELGDDANIVIVVWKMCGNFHENFCVTLETEFQETKPWML